MKWSEYARKMLEVSQISQSELARRLSSKLNKNVSQGTVNSRVNNENSLPPTDDELLLWADCLHLSGFHREQFIRLAYLERCPDYIKKELIKVEEKLSRSQVRIEKLEDEMRELKKLNGNLAHELAQATAEVARFIQERGG